MLGADHERGTVVEATPIPFVPGYLRAGYELDSVELAAQGRIGLPSGVLSCARLCSARSGIGRGPCSQEREEPGESLLDVRTS